MCQHIFEGRADGVTCTLCGYHMTASEYAEYLDQRNSKKPQGTARKPRKKKEATANE